MSDTAIPPRFWLIIPAAGIGVRMQADRPKQYLAVLGKTILEHTINCFLMHPQFHTICIAIAENDNYWSKLSSANNPKIVTCAGGVERADSVLNALDYLSAEASDDDWVWVHDAVRPCLSRLEIDALIGSLSLNDTGALLAVPVNDTVKRANTLGQSAQTIERAGLWRAMTPQVFRFGQLRHALKTCRDENIKITDESSALEHTGIFPVLVLGSENNIKVTHSSDLTIVKQHLQGHGLEIITPRIGSGFDVHAFEAGDQITLGGVKIPHTHGLKAHSDGDVLLHAIMDALLGALSLGDIGIHFSDADEKWSGANSRQLLKAVMQLVQNEGYRVVNVDSTIIAEMPKMAPFISEMKGNIAEALQVQPSAISVKATTTERLGFTGRKEGVACQASVLVVRQDINGI